MSTPSRSPLAKFPGVPVLLALAAEYSASKGGKHGGAKLDFQIDLESLLATAGCAEGESRELAERALRQARDAGLLSLDPIHRRTPDSIGKVRLPLGGEQRFFEALGVRSPTDEREQWSALFREASTWLVPAAHQHAWTVFCQRRAEAASVWQGMPPFARQDLDDGRQLLLLLPKLLSWQGQHHVRWASSLLTGDSKSLERRQATLEKLLAEATAGAVTSFETLGILPPVSGVTFHGPIQLLIGSSWRDFRNMDGPSTVSAADLDAASGVHCTAKRCVTVENRTPFESIARLKSGELLIHTSYPNSATLALLRLLHAHCPDMEFWHFGDTDPSGFHILADLRKRSGIPVRALHMEYRPGGKTTALSHRERTLLETLLPEMPGERASLEAMLTSGTKGCFEQESLQPPDLPHWPFYAP